MFQKCLLAVFLFSLSNTYAGQQDETVQSAFQQEEICSAHAEEAKTSPSKHVVSKKMRVLRAACFLLGCSWLRNGRVAGATLVYTPILREMWDYKPSEVRFYMTELALDAALIAYGLYKRQFDVLAVTLPGQAITLFRIYRAGKEKRKNEQITKSTIENKMVA